MTIIACLGAQAALLPGSVFEDHMVLQCGKNISVYGSDTPGQEVTVEFAGQSRAAIADSNGNWSVKLDPLAASSEGRAMTITGSSTARIEDVLVGEVWLAAGQSNMNWPVSGCDSAPNPANFDLIRICNREGAVGTGSTQVYGPAEYAALTPENFYEGHWQTLDASTVAPQSGVAYFFADALAESLKGRGPAGSDIPVGIVEIACGGTTTEAFIPPKYLDGIYLENCFADPRGVRTIGAWAAGRIAQNLQGYAHAGEDPHPHPYAPGFLYWTGVEQLENFSFRGVIWYQGESNAGFAVAPQSWNGDRVSEYQTMVMRRLVDSWREAFGDDDLPFYMVQLPRIDDPIRAKWPYYREAQDTVARSRNGVELALAPEFGADGSNVHPTRKKPVGERLALLARKNIYGEKNLAANGPRYRRHRIEDGKLVVEFEHAGNGLVSGDGDSLRHFEIAGTDRVFHPATAFILGDRVELHSPQVPHPIAVRYGWEMNIDLNLRNAAGLPAAPFRSDDWAVAPETARKIRIACIGDSITYGLGLDDPASESYPARLQAMLGTDLFVVGNFGHSGAGFVYKQYVGQPEHAAALAFEPDIVICNLGINDITTWGDYSRDDFIAAARTLFDSYRGLATDPLIVQWHRIGPLFPGQTYYGNPNVESLNDWVADAAGIVGADTIDMYRDFKSHPEWYPDNLHPNAAGALRIAEVTFDYLSAQSADRKAPSSAKRRHWKVFVLTGQSNSLGTTSDASESNISPGIEANDATIAFFWSNRDTSGDGSAAGLIGDSDGRIKALQSQQGSGANPIFWGPEIQFARSLYEAGLRDFLVVKASRGGGGNTWWYKDAADPQMYDHVVDTVDEALGQLPADDSFEVAGLLYLQGESDSPAEAAIAGERLATLIDNLRQDLPESENMHAVIGGIAAAGADRDEVRSQQSALAASDPRIDYFSNIDLQGHLYDNLHFDKSAKLTVGQRFAQAFLSSGKLDADPLISEFMALNSSSHQDEDGDYPGWIEIHNPGPSEIDLAGWSLAADPLLLSKWSFSTGTSIPAGGYLTVFASGKTRDDPTGELHSSFTLSNHGFLALLSPEGRIVQSFESIPEQYADRSYGISAPGELALVDAASGFRASVPTDGSIGPDWYLPGFDDGDSNVWQTAANGIGYERDMEFAEMDSADFGYKYEMDLNPSAQDLDGNGTEDWFAGVSGGATIPQTYSGGAASSEQSAATPERLFRTDFTGSLARSLLSDANSPWTIEMRVKKDASTTQGSEGWFAAALQNPGAGFATCVRFYDDKVRYWNSSDYMLGTDFATGFHTLRIAYAGGNRYFVWIDDSLLNEDLGTGFSGDNGSFNTGGAWYIGDYSAGIEGDWEVDYIRFTQDAYRPVGSSSAIDPIYSGLYDLDLGDAMQGHSREVYMRIPFELETSPDDIDTLALEMRYDDGFIAYLNGVEICRRNASGAAGSSGHAIWDRQDEYGLHPETIDISKRANLLRQGENLLAIRGLNHESSTSRFLIQTRMNASFGGGEAYQESVSPGAANSQSVTNLQAWKASHFTPSENADPFVSGDEADPDGDTIANLLEFGFRTDPRSVDSAVPLDIFIQRHNINGVANDYLTAIFQWREEAGSVGFDFDMSDRLDGGWNPSFASDSTVLSDHPQSDEGLRLVTVRDNLPVSQADFRLMRIGASNAQ